MRLKTFEQSLTDYIFSEPEIGELSSAIKTYPEDELNARLAIYRNNVYASLLSAMSDLYPAVVRTVGDNFFNASTRIYLSQHPPRSANLITLGQDFPEFLETFAPAESLPYLPDVARIDLACHQAYHAEDAEPLSARDFAALDISVLSGCGVNIHPSARLISSRYACFSIWNLSGDSQSEVNADNPESVLVIRPEMEVNTYSLTSGSYRFVYSLFSGGTLEQALQTGIQSEDSFNPTEAMQFLIQSGLATKITGDRCP